VRQAADRSTYSRFRDIGEFGGEDLAGASQK